MSFETRLMAPGTFNVDLIPDTPEWVCRLTARAIAEVIILPGRVTNPRKVPVAQLRADAAYVGIHVGRPDLRLGFAGYGPAFLLRLAKYRQDQTVSKRPLYHGSNDSHVRNNVLRVGNSETNGLTAGPIMVAAGAGSPTKGGKIPSGQEPLEYLGDVARRFGKEWDIRDGRNLEVADRSALFTVTPTCIATPKAGGSDLNLAGLEAVRFTERDDWDDFVTTVAVPFTAPDYAFGETYAVGDTVVATSGIYYECTTAHTSSGANLPPNAGFWQAVNPYGEATTGSPPYVNPFTAAALVSRRVAPARNATTIDDATDIATAQLGRYDQPHRDIKLDSATFALNKTSGGAGKVRAGDNIYAYSPRHDLFDNTAQIPHRGRKVPAATIRVQGIVTDVDDRMTVVVHTYNGSTQELDDITPWVKAVPAKDARQVLDLGEPRRRRPTTAVTL